MISVLPLILPLAAIDSLNPTSITGTIYLAGRGQMARLRLFILGVYFTYLSIGLALLLGPAAAIRSEVSGTPAIFGPLVEVAVGGLLVGMGIRAWRHRGLTRPRASQAAHTKGRSGLVLGFLSTLADLPTAGPLFVAAALLAGANGWGRLAGLGLYDVVYISPLLAIAFAHGWAAAHPGSANRRSRLAYLPRVAALCLAGAIIGCEGAVALV